MEKSQHIGCRVGSCKFHENNNECSLRSIMVEPRTGGNTGQAKDESLCGSYEVKP
jgi:hypothetical protein